VIWLRVWSMKPGEYAGAVPGLARVGQFAAGVVEQALAPLQHRRRAGGCRLRARQRRMVGQQRQAGAGAGVFAPVIELAAQFAGIGVEVAQRVRYSTR
jgi:hypothetical protein